MKLLLVKLVKYISPVVMLAAVFFDANFMYLSSNEITMPKYFTGLFILGTLLIVVHTIEGVFAGILVKKQQAQTKTDKNPVLYGIYTFLIGTVGIYELYETEEG